MRWIDGLSKAQRVVVVIALGLVLWAVGSYLVNLGQGEVAVGWYAYSAPDLRAKHTRQRASSLGARDHLASAHRRMGTCVGESAAAIVGESSV
jgi:hypothetical protein